MTTTKYVLSSKDDFEAAVIADKITKNMPIGSRTLVIDNITCLIRKTAVDKKVITKGSPMWDLEFYPVGNKHFEFDYRMGIHNDRVTPELAETGADLNGLSLGDRLPAGSKPRLAHITFTNNEAEPLLVAEGDAPKGSSSWFGDTDNVLSWHGIGSMDGCANDYRAYRYIPSVGNWYDTPLYESAFYTTTAESHKAPESPNHLEGDRRLTRPDGYPANSEPPLCDERKVYRNGKLVHTAFYPILCAGEVQDEQDPKKFWLRVLCGRWFTEPDGYSPVYGDTDYMFEAHQLSGFFLYKESKDGWTVEIIEIPPVAEGLPTTSFVAQQPHFNASCTKIVGLIETAFKEDRPSTYRNSKLVSIARAYVFSIDVPSALCTLTEPASTSLYQRDKADSSLSVFENAEYKQIIAVAPTTSDIAKIVITDKVLVTADCALSDNAFTQGQAAWIGGSEQPRVDAMQAYFEELGAAKLPEMRALYKEWNNTTELPPSSNHWASWCNFQVWTINDQDGIDHGFVESSVPYNHYPGWASFGVSINLATGEVSAGSGYWPIAAQLDSHTVVITRSKKRTVTTTRSRDLDVFGTTFLSSKQDIQTTAGYKLEYFGVGFWFRRIEKITVSDGNTLYGWRPDIYVRTDRSIGLLPVDASSTNGGPLDDMRVVAADPRKSAAIVKNIDTGDLNFVGVPQVTF